MFLQLVFRGIFVRCIEIYLYHYQRVVHIMLSQLIFYSIYVGCIEIILYHH